MRAGGLNRLRLFEQAEECHGHWIAHLPLGQMNVAFRQIAAQGAMYVRRTELREDDRVSQHGQIKTTQARQCTGARCALSQAHMFAASYCVVKRAKITAKKEWQAHNKIETDQVDR